MDIYSDPISDALRVRPIKDVCPEFEYDDEYPLFNPTKSSHGIFNAFYGKKHTPQTKKRLKRAWSKNIERKQNLVEFNKLMAADKKGKKPDQLYAIGKCEHCSFEGTQSNITKWHSDNCKLNPNNQNNEIGLFEYISCPICGYRCDTSKANSRRNLKVYHIDNCKR